MQVKRTFTKYKVTFISNKGGETLDTFETYYKPNYSQIRKRFTRETGNKDFHLIISEEKETRFMGIEDFLKYSHTDDDF